MRRRDCNELLLRKNLVLCVRLAVFVLHELTEAGYIFLYFLAVVHIVVVVARSLGVCVCVCVPGFFVIWGGGGGANDLQLRRAVERKNAYPVRGNGCKTGLGVQPQLQPNFCRYRTFYPKNLYFLLRGSVVMICHLQLWLQMEVNMIIISPFVQKLIYSFSSYT